MQKFIQNPNVCFPSAILRTGHSDLRIEGGGAIRCNCQKVA